MPAILYTFQFIADILTKILVYIKFSLPREQVKSKVAQLTPLSP